MTKVWLPVAWTEQPPAVVSFPELSNGVEHFALVFEPVDIVPLVRLHSECITGDLLGSLRCDCGPQLKDSLRMLSHSGGVLLYLRQEGRGIGLHNKLSAYALQDQGLDTYEANRRLGRGEDERSFTPGAEMLKALGISRCRLLTNNPDKVHGLKSAGIEVKEVVPTGLFLQAYNFSYLQTKAGAGRHRFGKADQDRLLKQEDSYAGPVPPTERTL